MGNRDYRKEEKKKKKKKDKPVATAGRHVFQHQHHFLDVHSDGTGSPDLDGNRHDGAAGNPDAV